MPILNLKLSVLSDDAFVIGCVKEKLNGPIGVNTFNPIKITFMGWSAILKDIKKAKTIKEAFSVTFGPPNTRLRGGSF